MKNFWIKFFIPITGTLMLLSGLTNVIFRIFKPNGYEKVLEIAGGDIYGGQLFFGIGFLTCYFLLKRYGAKENKKK